MAEVAGIHENLGQEEGVRGKKRKRRSGDTEVGIKESKMTGFLAGMEVREEVLEEMVDEPGNIQEKAEEELVLKYSGKKTKTVHNKEKPYQCEHENCCANFANREHRLDHYRSKHGLDKPKCQEENCDKEFTSRQALDRHIKIVHYKEVYHCMEQSCDARFDRLLDLKAHHMVWHRSQHS